MIIETISDGDTWSGGSGSHRRTRERAAEEAGARGSGDEQIARPETSERSYDGKVLPPSTNRIYDAAGRLVWSRDDTLDQELTYAYDTEGRGTRLERSGKTTSCAYGNAGELLSVTGA